MLHYVGTKCLSYFIVRHDSLSAHRIMVDLIMINDNGWLWTLVHELWLVQEWLVHELLVHELSVHELLVHELWLWFMNYSSWTAVVHEPLLCHFMFKNFSWTFQELQFMNSSWTVHEQFIIISPGQWAKIAKSGLELLSALIQGTCVPNFKRIRTKTEGRYRFLRKSVFSIKYPVT